MQRNKNKNMLLELLKQVFYLYKFFICSLFRETILILFQLSTASSGSFITESSHQPNSESNSDQFKIIVQEAAQDIKRFKQALK